MPLHPCEAGHDYSLPFVIQRTKKGKVTLIRVVKECLGCGHTMEVIPKAEQPATSRIARYELT